METNFNFNSQICTSRLQSERLLALGLKKETADCRWTGVVKDSRGKDIPKNEQMWFLQLSESENYQTCGFSRTEFLPAWSLHRLIEMMPFDIWHTEYEDSPRLRHTFYFSKYAPSYNSYEDIDFRAHPTLYDNIIDCIEWLIKEGYFNKEYLV